ncbi:hypothetical protein [Streptomyces sp. NPDC046685]|uniref:hypothetical protein n=1 Tax=Streptomyces sp. NPDC046685 TaxID=3157202 RepID=UPI0033C8F0D7
MTAAGIDRIPWQRRHEVTPDQVMCPLDQVATASPGESVRGVLPRLASAAENRVLVLDPATRALLGIVSERDIDHAVTWLATTRPRP